MAILKSNSVILGTEINRTAIDRTVAAPVGKHGPHLPHGDSAKTHPTKHGSPARHGHHLEPARDKRAGFDAERRRRFAEGVDWYVVFWISLLHVGALAAPFVFTWQALLLTFFLGWLTGGIGICLGYHRLLTHQSFRTYRPVKWFIAWLGGLAGEGSAVHWVANHRKHHALSDEVGDPHSPQDGPWWAHMFWTTPNMARTTYDDHNRRWAPDMMKDRMLVFLDRTFIVWQILFGLALYGLGYWLGGNLMGWSFVVWGMFVRLCYVLHATWLVNSATHMWGYRNYETADNSRNLWWVALITYGEGWHNNHHAYPRMARHGHRWWEIDTTFMAIRVLESLGLAWDVVDQKHRKRTDESTVQAA
jgi:stearoyl-CoA desaturase (delta-9 desaturase)